MWQVDDLVEIGDLEGYIRRSVNILVYCSRGYCQSKNCMRELISSTQMGKAFIALVDPDPSRGGLGLEEIRGELLAAEGSYLKWSFDSDSTPDGAALFTHLFASDAIEWNRIGA